MPSVKETQIWTNWFLRSSWKSYISQPQQQQAVVTSFWWATDSLLPVFQVCQCLRSEQKTKSKLWFDSDKENAVFLCSKQATNTGKEEEVLWTMVLAVCLGSISLFYWQNNQDKSNLELKWQSEQLCSTHTVAAVCVTWHTHSIFKTPSERGEILAVWCYLMSPQDRIFSKTGYVVLAPFSDT